MAAANRKMSDVWLHFSKPQNGEVKCQLCNNSLSYSNTTSNLRDHLQRKLKDKYSSPLFDPKQSNLLTFRQSSCSESRKADLVVKIVGYIARDLKPLNTVEGSGFKDMIETCSPG